MKSYIPIVLISTITILLNVFTDLPIYMSGLIGGVLGFFIYLIQARYFKK